MMQYDTGTGFPLGNPQENPVRDALVPTDTQVRQAAGRMILSASGWRAVFAESGDEEDAGEGIGGANTVISALIAEVFSDYMIERKGKGCKVALGIDARPTGSAVADTMLRVLAGKGIDARYLFITAAPEIMAFSRSLDGFVYVSASHNPVGHNGVKFGLDDGGVLPGQETARLTAAFRASYEAPDAAKRAAALAAECPAETLAKIYSEVPRNKARAAESYALFTRRVVSGREDGALQDEFFAAIKEGVRRQPLSVVCDMNGSARTLSIDAEFLGGLGVGFHTINGKPRQIAHAIIPEPENLVHCAREMARLKEKNPAVTLGYMPDCDGDRGNIVYWNDKSGCAEVLKAQEVFALSVLSELAYLDWRTDGRPGKTAVAVNGPTSMRIEEIAGAFGAEVFRAEVGEANVVNLAREARAKGFAVPILGEGSNGGNITHPAAVRDPLNTIFALIKLLVLRDTESGGTTRPGLFHRWCVRSGQEGAYKDGFTLRDVIATLPPYTTTGVSERRALLRIAECDHAALKSRFQREFEASWEKRRQELLERYGIASYEAVCNNGTKETRNLTDYSLSGKGGLKIILKDADGKSTAFIWMRGSGTEPVFRVMCDVKGNRPEMEAELLAWETELLRAADSAS